MTEDEWLRRVDTRRTQSLSRVNTREDLFLGKGRGDFLAGAGD